MISPKDSRGRTPIPQSGGGYSGNILRSNDFGALQKNFVVKNFGLAYPNLVIVINNNILLLFIVIFTI